MNAQDRTVAAVVGWLGALTVIIGTMLPAVSVGAFSGESMIHSTDGVVMAVLALVVAWRVYRTFTLREHPAWIVWPALVIGGILAYDWNTNVTSVRIDELDITVARSAGTGLYVIALGVVLALASGIALWRLKRADDAPSAPGGPPLSDEQDRERRRAHALTRQGVGR